MTAGARRWPLALAMLVLGCGRSPAAAARTGAEDSGPAPPAEWVRLPAGSFIMGSPQTEPCRRPDEVEHQVTFRSALHIWSTEVTQQQFFSVMGYNPATFGPQGFQGGCTSPSCPVEEVTWHEAAAYCNALSVAAALSGCYVCAGVGRQIRCGEAPAVKGAAFPACTGYRLPTEAEWEYAYRAGTRTTLYNSATTGCGEINSEAEVIAWYEKNAGGTTHPVGLKRPNAWGLYDMAGNVWEWTNDWFGSLGAGAVVEPVGAGTDPLKVLRGGSWSESWDHGRAARREAFWPEARGNYVGFRCVQIAPAPPPS